MNPELTQKAAKRGQEVFEQEADALKAAGARLGEGFERAVEAILACRGKVVFTGMGKHGIVARKIAATLASTGTPSYFMHPGEGAHGDLGMVASEDLVVAVSNSGNTAELLGCVPYFKRNHNVIIAITGNVKSELARHADVVLDIAVEREVCPLNLAPMTSTTVALAMGDALAVVLMERRGFKADDFALRHPSGTLGKRLLLQVKDFVKDGRNPVVRENDTFEQAMAEITKANLGGVSVVNAEGLLAGILTDGDLRRIFQREAKRDDQSVRSVLGRRVSELMTPNPMRVSEDTLAVKALNIMEDGKRKIFVLPVVDGAGKPVAMIHLHDLVSAGV
ncbi:MAG: KpsF/GutQ family sugar-phosphate isomerase [Candidatus Sumerlaeaceae bacterium]|nr:KpsF/GutQ family sugar-phosphate isomerase [Candidatus Sumerlaeaceae bacterium]